ncbi:MAG: GIY-YIG nuclease family protein [bacterium]|nr:GIY-YIG nuclease family protein [bacterium]
MHYVYILQERKGELYFGCTNDLKKRIREHNEGKSKSTKGGHWRLVYYEAYSAPKDAWNRESRIKNHGQAKRQLKDRIVNSLLGS